ncbi:MAG TPA: acetyl-coenzyme A synthetase N-terminal domain-containing protein [Steroidobacter sp.]|jgi:acyl-coenzyme A synthetase/AMP-(fatty) acid ligase|nr:acetyl-coenzyme A synthetase N-terminal domain-containing protein [Steroidobacter sp.]
MPDDLIFPVPDDFQGRAWIDHSTYRHEYARSLADPEGFWAEQAERLEWCTAPTAIRALIRHGEEAVKKTSRNRFMMYDIPSMA